jgi:C1A family cysteine protease
MPAVFSRSATAFVFTFLVAIIALVQQINAMPTASKLKLAAKKEIKIDRSLPAIINWVDRGVIPPAYDQGQCGDAEIFSTFVNIQAVNAITNNFNFTGLSLNQFIKCIPNGCNGMAENAIEKYLRSVNGNIASNTTNITPEFCNTAAKLSNPAARVIAFKNIIGDETAIHAELVNGPVTVAIDADSWQTYTGGVLNDCPASQIDDSAVIVGINVADEKNPYWILQNSWGTAFGENGRIKIKYGTNQCGITTDATSVDTAKN